MHREALSKAPLRPSLRSTSRHGGNAGSVGSRTHHVRRIRSSGDDRLVGNRTPAWLKAPSIVEARPRFGRFSQLERRCARRSCLKCKTRRTVTRALASSQIDPVRKPLRGGETIDAESRAEELRCSSNHVQLRLDVFEKRVSDPARTLLIPDETFAEIGLRLWRDNQSLLHGLRWSRAFTSGQDAPSVGFF